MYFQDRNNSSEPFQDFFISEISFLMGLSKRNDFFSHYLKNRFFVERFTNTYVEHYIGCSLRSPQNFFHLINILKNLGPQLLHNRISSPLKSKNCLSSPTFFS